MSSIFETSTYSIPILYIISHVLIGYLGYFFPTIIVCFILYQLYQYTIDIRFFLLSSCKTKKNHEKGNNFKHTCRKLGEASIGFILGWLINSDFTILASE